MATDDHRVGHARDHLRHLAHQPLGGGQELVGADPEHGEVRLVHQVDAQPLLALGKADVVAQPAKLGRGLDPAHQLGGKAPELLPVDLPRHRALAMPAGHVARDGDGARAGLPLAVRVIVRADDRRADMPFEPALFCLYSIRVGVK